MIRHVVMFKWNDGVDDAHVAAASAALTALGESLPVVRRYVHGPDLGLNDGNFDYVVVGDFADADDYATYRDHPDHRALIAEHIADFVAARSAVQYEFDTGE